MSNIELVFVPTSARISQVVVIKLLDVQEGQNLVTAVLNLLGGIQDILDTVRVSLTLLPALLTQPPHHTQRPGQMSLEVLNDRELRLLLLRLVLSAGRIVQPGPVRSVGPVGTVWGVSVLVFLSSHIIIIMTRLWPVFSWIRILVRVAGSSHRFWLIVGILEAARMFGGVTGVFTMVRVTSIISEGWLSCCLIRISV